MVYSFFNKIITGFLAGSEIMPVDTGGGVQVGATTGQIANAPGPFGSGGQGFGRSGNIFTYAPPSPGVSPAATGSDIVIANFVLPANSFDASGRTLQLMASGSFGATANNKRIKLFVGATTATVGSAIVGGSAIADTGTVTTNGGGWQLGAEITKIGAFGSNTQVALHNQAQVGAAVSALLAQQYLTLAENAAINITLTANATTATSDIVAAFMQLFAQN